MCKQYSVSSFSQGTCSVLLQFSKMQFRPLPAAPDLESTEELGLQDLAHCCPTPIPVLTLTPGTAFSQRELPTPCPTAI